MSPTALLPLCKTHDVSYLCEIVEAITTKLWGRGHDTLPRMKVQKSPCQIGFSCVPTAASSVPANCVVCPQIQLCIHGYMLCTNKHNMYLKCLTRFNCICVRSKFLWGSGVVDVEGGNSERCLKWDGGSWRHH